MNLTCFALSRFSGRPWAIAPAQMEGLLAGAALTPGVHLPSWLAETARTQAYSVSARGIAVIPIMGPLVARGGWLTALLGASECGSIAEAVSTAAADRAVRALLLEVDSAGGEVGGLFDLVAEIGATKTRAGKPLWAVGSESALSAAMPSPQPPIAFTSRAPARSGRSASSPCTSTRARPTPWPG